MEKKNSKVDKKAFILNRKEIHQRQEAIIKKKKTWHWNSKLKSKPYYLTV